MKNQIGTTDAFMSPINGGEHLEKNHLWLGKALFGRGVIKLKK